MAVTQNCRHMGESSTSTLSAQSTEEASKPAWVGKEPSPEERTLRGVVKLQVGGGGGSGKGNSVCIHGGVGAEEYRTVGV